MTSSQAIIKRVSDLSISRDGEGGKQPTNSGGSFAQYHIEKAQDAWESMKYWHTYVHQEYPLQVSFINVIKNDAKLVWALIKIGAANPSFGLYVSIALALIANRPPLAIGIGIVYALYVAARVYVEYQYLLSRGILNLNAHEFRFTLGNSDTTTFVDPNNNNFGLEGPRNSEELDLGFEEGALDFRNPSIDDILRNSINDGFNSGGGYYDYDDNRADEMLA